MKTTNALRRPRPFFVGEGEGEGREVCVCVQALQTIRRKRRGQKDVWGGVRGAILPLHTHTHMKQLRLLCHSLGLC